MPILMLDPKACTHCPENANALGVYLISLKTVAGNMRPT